MINLQAFPFYLYIADVELYWVTLIKDDSTKAHIEILTQWQTISSVPYKLDVVETHYTNIYKALSELNLAKKYINFDSGNNKLCCTKDDIKQILLLSHPNTNLSTITISCSHNDKSLIIDKDIPLNNAIKIYNELVSKLKPNPKKCAKSNGIEKGWVFI